MHILRKVLSIRIQRETPLISHYDTVHCVQICNFKFNENIEPNYVIRLYRGVNLLDLSGYEHQYVFQSDME